MTFERKRSNWWYLVPVFLGIPGGIVAYFALRYDDLEKAKQCLYLGLILGSIAIILEVFFAASYPDLEELAKY